MLDVTVVLTDSTQVQHQETLMTKTLRRFSCYRVLLFVLKDLLITQIVLLGIIKKPVISSSGHIYYHNTD